MLSLFFPLSLNAQTTRQLKVYQKTGMVDVVPMNANSAIRHSCFDLNGQKQQDYVTIVVKDAEGYDRQYLISQLDSLVLPTGQRVVFVGSMQSQLRYAPRRTSLNGRFPGTAGSGNVTFRWMENDPIRLSTGDVSHAEQLTDSKTSAQFVFWDTKLDADSYQVYYPGKSVTISDVQTQMGANNSDHIGPSGDCGTALALRNENDSSYSFTLDHKVAYLCFLPHIDHLPSVRIEKIKLSCDATIAGTYQLTMPGLSDATNTSNTIMLYLRPQRTLDFFLGHDVQAEQDSCAAYMVIAPQQNSQSFTATYYVTDTLSHISATYKQSFTFQPLENTVYPVTCHIPESIFQDIDLGYDYVWSNRNMGSMLPSEAGNYYTHDATEALVSGSWQLPPDDAVTELIDKCTWEWGEYNGVGGWLVSGTNNGNDDVSVPRLFLPAAGYRENGAMQGAGNGYYWMASDVSDPSGQAHVLSASREQRQKVLMNSSLGMNARLVKPIIREFRFQNGTTQHVDLRTHGPGYYITVYDDGGPNGYYSHGFNGYLRITCAEGYKLNIRGNMSTESCCDYLKVYNVTENGNVEYASASGVSTFVNITTNTNDILLYFHSDGSVNSSGFNLIVTIQRQLTIYDLVVNEVEGGTLVIQHPTVDSRHSTANPEDTIRLTATPAPGYVLHHIEVKADTSVLTLYEDDPRLFQDAASASRHFVMCDTVRVRDGNWWHDESHFLMPYGDVTITPVFVNTDDDLWLCMAGNDTTKVERKYTQRLLDNGMSKFRVYDYGGKNNSSYENNVNGYMFVDAPAGYVMQMSGTVWTEGSCDPLNIYDGFNTSYFCLKSIGGSGTFSTQTHNNVAFFYFHTDQSKYDYAGYEVNVTLKPDTITQYNIPANIGIDLLTEHMDYLLKQGITSMMVYDSNGPGQNYSNNCDGWLRFNLPEGYKVHVYGTSDSEHCDHLYVYDNEVLKYDFTNIGNHLDYTTETNRLLLKFTSDGSINYAGVSLKVDFIKDEE